MKKLLVILMALGLVGISTVAVAQITPPEPVASVCSTQVLRIDCSLVGQTPGCSPFNFEDGYGSGCTNKDYSNRAIFSICFCPNTAENFREGSRIGVRLSILVDKNDGLGPRVLDNGGAYWATADTIIHFGKYASWEAACADDAFDFSFGPGHFYKSTDLTPLGYITPYLGTNCAVPTSPDQRTNVYVTDRTSGYTITLDDEILALNRWAIDIPEIRIDPALLHNGECIYVRVEFLNQNIGRGICSDCPPICDGMIKVACVCCTDADAMSATCFFPYFTGTNAANEDNPYWNGIAIQNTSSVAGTATLTAYEKNGIGTATFTTPEIPARGMFVETLDRIEWDAGSTLSGGPVYINVVTTFPGVDGFAMMANSYPEFNGIGESMGYLCRQGH